MTIPQRGGRPTREEAAAQTTLILDQARTLFSRKGYAGTTIDALAAELHSSKHTIYRRYANKLAVFEAVVERDIVGFRSALREAAASEDEPIASLKALAGVYFGFSVSPSYSAMYAAIALEASSSPQLRAKLRHWMDIALEPLKDAVEAAAAAEGWQQARPAEILQVLIDLLDGAANRLKWHEATASEQDDMFAARWTIFTELARSCFAIGESPS